MATESHRGRERQKYGLSKRGSFLPLKNGEGHCTCSTFKGRLGRRNPGDGFKPRVRVTVSRGRDPETAHDR